MRGRAPPVGGTSRGLPSGAGPSHLPAEPSEEGLLPRPPGLVSDGQGSPRRPDLPESRQCVEQGDREGRTASGRGVRQAGGEPGKMCRQPPPAQVLPREEQAVARRQSITAATAKGRLERAEAAVI